MKQFSHTPLSSKFKPITIGNIFYIISSEIGNKIEQKYGKYDIPLAMQEISEHEMRSNIKNK